MLTLENSSLYVGLDDSNHGGTTQGEIIVASFSFFHEDSIVRDYGTSKDDSRVSKWFEQGEGKRNLRYCILTNERFRRGNQNLVYAAPYLVNDFLKTCQQKIDSLKIYLDGNMFRESKIALRKEFEPGVNSFVVDNFRKEQKLHHCPFVIYASHVLSNAILNQDYTVIKPDKIVNVPD